MKKCKIYLKETRPDVSINFYDNKENIEFFENQLTLDESNLSTFSVEISEDSLIRTTNWEYEYEGPWLNFLMGDIISLVFLWQNEMYDNEQQIAHGPYIFEIYENGSVTTRGTLSNPSVRI
jgi:hypothetical protein